MDRDVFFKQLHCQLAEKYHVPVEAISYIRGGMVEHKRDKEELIIFVENHLTSRNKSIEDINKHYLSRKHKYCKEFQCVTYREQLKENTMKKIQFRQSVLFFLKSITTEQWEEITQKTPYDKFTY